MYIRHRYLQLVSLPGLQGTPLDAHQDGSMSAASFRNNYETRDGLWQIIFQNATGPGKTHDPPNIEYYGTIYMMILEISDNIG